MFEFLYVKWVWILTLSYLADNRKVYISRVNWIPTRKSKRKLNNHKAYALSYSESNLVSHIYHNLLVYVMYQNSSIVSVSTVFVKNFTSIKPEDSHLFRAFI